MNETSPRRLSIYVPNLLKRRGALIAMLGLSALAAFIAVAVAATGRQSAEGAPASVITGFGLELGLPAGWHGRVYQRGAEGAITLEAATVPLAPIGDNSSQETEARMGTDDAYIQLSDIGSPPPYLGSEPGWERLTLPLAIDEADLHRFVEGNALPANVTRAVVINNRAIMLYCGFGSWPSESSIANLNRVLSSLSVAPR